MGAVTGRRGAAPAGVDAPVQYGPRIAAVIVYLHAGQFLSKKRTAQALAELFGVPLSSGTVAALTAKAAGRLEGFPEEIRARIVGAAVAGFDETGLRVEGRLRWVHCARTGKYTLLSCHPRRGTEAMDAMGVLPGFAGIAVHDAWAPYDAYAAPGHQLCPCSRRTGTAGRRGPGPRRAVVLGDPGRGRARRDAAPGHRRDRAGPRRR